MLIEKDALPGTVVIASSSGFVITSAADFHIATLISGFHLNKLDKCSVNPCSIANSCNLSESIFLFNRPTILME